LGGVRKSTERSEWSITWNVPTLFRGASLTAATLVPPSATRSAKHATIIAGEGFLIL
jgi:hypothetical protein